MLNVSIATSELTHLKFEYANNEYIATLVDLKGLPVIRGYGISPALAMNDLHHNLL